MSSTFVELPMYPVFHIPSILERNSLEKRISLLIHIKILSRHTAQRHSMPHSWILINLSPSPLAEAQGYDVNFLRSSRVFSKNRRRRHNSLALQNGQGWQFQPPESSLSTKEPSIISRDAKCQLRVPPYPVLQSHSKNLCHFYSGMQLIGTAVSDWVFKKTSQPQQRGRPWLKLKLQSLYSYHTIHTLWPQINIYSGRTGNTNIDSQGLSKHYLIPRQLDF